MSSRALDRHSRRCFASQVLTQQLPQRIGTTGQEFSLDDQPLRPLGGERRLGMIGFVFVQFELAGTLREGDFPFAQADFAQLQCRGALPDFLSAFFIALLLRKFQRRECLLAASQRSLAFGQLRLPCRFRFMVFAQDQLKVALILSEFRFACVGVGVAAIKFGLPLIEQCSQLLQLRSRDAQHFQRGCA